MKILLTNCEGYLLSESSRIIYSPGYENPNLAKSEHECLCIISKLVEGVLVNAGHTIIARRYDDSKFASYQFDKARDSRGCDLAIMLALNNSQNSNAQFSTCMISTVQTNNTSNLFENMMHSLARFMPIQSRYPNSLRRIPYLESCKRNGTPAIIVLPFFITDRKLDDNLLGKYMKDAATAIAESIIAYRAEAPVPREITEF